MIYKTIPTVAYFWKHSMNVLFICYELYERPAKIAKLLNNNGINIDIIYRRYTDKSFLSFFNEAFKMNRLNNIQRILKKKEYIAIHYFSKSIDKYSSDLLEYSLPFIYDYKDLFQGVISIPVEQEFLDIQKQLINKSFAISHRDGQLSRYFEKNMICLNKKILHLRDLVIDLKINNSMENMNSVCFGGNFIIEKMNPNYSGLGQIQIAKELSKQKIHYHLYPFIHNFSNKYNELSEYIDLDRESKYFNLHKRLNFNEYINEISQYSFGSQILAFLHFENAENLHYLIEPVVGIPSRLFDYISAELPVIFDESFIEPSEIISQFGIGISLKKKELFQLKNLISYKEYSVMKKSVIDYKAHLIESNKNIFLELSDLYESFRNECGQYVKNRIGARQIDILKDKFILLFSRLK